MDFSRDALIAFIAGVGQTCVGIIAFVIFSQLLGVAKYGTYLLFFGLVVILSSLSDLGVDNSVQKQVSQEASLKDNVQYYTSGLILKSILVTFTLTLVVVLRNPINSYLGEEMSLYLVPTILVYQFGIFQLKMLQAELKVGLSKIIRALQRVAFVVLGIFVVSLGFGVRYLSVCLMVSWLLCIIFSTWSLGFSLEIPNKPDFIVLLGFSKYDAVSSVIGGALYSWMDTVAIGFFLGPAFVTIYEGAWRIGGGVMLLSQAIATTIFPHISSWDEQDNIGKIEEAVSASTTWSLFLVIPAIVGGLFIGGDLVTILTGEQVAAAHFTLVLILLGKVPEGINNVISKSLIGLNKPMLLAKSMLIFAFANILLNVIFTPLWGIAGAAIATVIAFAIGAYLNYSYINRFVQVRFQWRIITMFIVSSIMMGATVGILSYLTDFSRIISVSILGVVGLLSYIIFLTAIPSTREFILRSPIAQFVPSDALGKVFHNGN